MTSESVESIIQRTITNLLSTHLNQVESRDVTVLKDNENDAANQSFPKIWVLLPQAFEEEHLDQGMKQVVYKCSLYIQDQHRDINTARRSCDLVYQEIQKVFYDYPTLYLSQFYVCDSSFFRFDTIEPEEFGKLSVEKPVDIYITTVIQTGNIYDSTFGLTS